LETNGEPKMPTNNRVVNIAYFGNSHGAFLKYFVDRFSKLTPKIDTEPFMPNGTSHNLSVKYSGKVERFAFEDPTGQPVNNYEFVEKNEPHILILIDEDSIFNYTRFMFFRDADHEFVGTSFKEANNLVTLSKEFLKMYNKKIKEVYNYDISTGKCPKIIVRDFLKYFFLNPNDNRAFINSKKTLKNINNKTFCVNLSDIWHTEKFIEKMKEASNQLGLDLLLDEEAISLHKKFLSKRATNNTFNRVFEVIEHIVQKKYYDCTKLDLVEQAYLSAWLEKNNSFIQIPHTREFFKDTLEIIEYIEFYPNHYKAMNPNLPMFNGIPNPFHLWSLKK
jgi:hypothetical protein